MREADGVITLFFVKHDNVAHKSVLRTRCLSFICVLLIDHQQNI
jgi:hypothetical protein